MEETDYNNDKSATNIENATIVSAFLSNVNNNRNLEKYIEYGKKLLNLNNIY